MAKHTLTDEEVKHVAGLIRIKLKEEEVHKYNELLSTVLDHLEIFNELNTDDTEITSQVTGLTNVFREDETETSLPVDDAVKNAHEKENGYIKVSRVVKK